MSNVRIAFQLVERFQKGYLQVEPKLNHGDYFPKHFMAKEGKIISILDWGETRSDSPIYDFANWDFWTGQELPTTWLIEGYIDKSLFDSNFNDLLHFIKIMIGLEVLEWYHGEKYQEMIEKTKRRIIIDVTYFK